MHYFSFCGANIVIFSLFGKIYIINLLTSAQKDCFPGGFYKLIEMDFEFMSSRFLFKVEE